MHRFGAWGLSAALATGAGAPLAIAADPAPRPPEARSADNKPWYARLAGTDDKKDPPAPARPIAYAPLSAEVLAEALRAEQDAYLRRLDVCGKLRQIAAQANDDALFAEADRLEQQATTLYHQRVARLGVKGGPRGSTAPAMVRTPADVLDSKLGSGIAADPRNAKTPGKPDTSTAELRPGRGGKP